MVVNIVPRRWRVFKSNARRRPLTILEKNGVVERLDLSKMEKAQSMKLDVGLSKAFGLKQLLEPTS